MGVFVQEAGRQRMKGKEKNRAEQSRLVKPAVPSPPKVGA